MKMRYSEFSFILLNYNYKYISKTKNKNNNETLSGIKPEPCGKKANVVRTELQSALSFFLSNFSTKYLS